MPFLATPYWEPRRPIAQYGDDFFQIGDVLIQWGRNSNNQTVTYPKPYRSTPLLNGTAGGFCTTVRRDTGSTTSHRCTTYQYTSALACNYDWWVIGKTDRVIPIGATGALTREELFQQIEIDGITASGFMQIGGFKFEWDERSNNNATYTYDRPFLSGRVGLGSITRAVCTAARYASTTLTTLRCSIFQNAECAGVFSTMSVGNADPALIVPTTGLSIVIGDTSLQVGNVRLQWGTFNHLDTVTYGPYDARPPMGGMVRNVDAATSMRIESNDADDATLGTYSRATARLGAGHYSVIGILDSAAADPGGKILKPGEIYYL